MYKCEKCGKEVTEKYGSGRFCSRQCANSRTFSEESRAKKSIANKGLVAYSNGTEVRYFRDGDKIPEGFIHGNFNAVKYFENFDEYVEAVNIRDAAGACRLYNPNATYPKVIYKRVKSAHEHKLRVRQSRDFYTAACKASIAKHNQQVLEEYEQLLATKAANKSFSVDNTFVFAKYLSVTMPNHPRQHQGHVFVHILLAEALLDRALGPKEIVHHKDANKLHNTFDNIYIFDSLASHARFHHSSCGWLRIEGDVLICDALSIEELKEIYSKLTFD